MTLRERALAAVNHKDVFPVPTDVMENLIYPTLEGGLCRHFGLAAGDHEGVLRALGACSRWGGPVYVGPPLELAPVQPPCTFPLPRATRNIWGGWAGLNTYSSEFERPLAQLSSVAEIEKHRWPDPDWFDYGRVAVFDADPATFPSVASWARQHQDTLRILGGFEPIFSRILDLCGMEAGLMLTADDTLLAGLVTQITDFLEEYYRRLAVAAQGHVDVLAFGDDFAGQNAMLLSPTTWRKHFLSAWKRLFAVAHAHGMKTMLHCCGSIRPVLGDLIDAGLDIYEVVQITAKDMEATALKREFGQHLTFYGGIDTQQILPQGTPAEVRAEVRRVVDILGRNGGYILASMHLMQNDIPVENCLAMYDEAHQHGTRSPSFAMPRKTLVS